MIAFTLPTALFFQSTVDIESIGGGSKLASGDAYFGAVPRLTAVSCCLQPYDAVKTMEFAKLGQEISHKAYFDTDYGLTTTDRLRLTGTSRLFEVRGVMNFDEASRLWRVDLRERPE